MHVERRTRVNSHLNGLINNFHLNRGQIGRFSHFLPSANLSPIGDGVDVGCSEERFSEYVTEMKPITDRVISGLEPAPEA